MKQILLLLMAFFCLHATTTAITQTLINNPAKICSNEWQTLYNINPNYELYLKKQANNPPVANNFDTCSVAGATISINLNTLCFDPDNDPLNFAIVTQPTAGQLAFNAGIITYVPTTTGFQDQITYQVCDPSNLCSTAVIAINLAEIESIEIPPTPTLNYTANINQPVQVCDGYLGGYFLNNCMPNLFTACITNNPTLGSIAYSSDNCITYTPSQAAIDTIVLTTCGDAPPPSFFTCNGWQQISNCNKFYYIVNSQNQASSPPTANNFDTCSVAGATITINLNTLCFDPDNDPLNFAIVTQPTAGQLAFNAGIITYVPTTTGFQDQITYQVCDPSNLCSTATIAITLADVESLSIPEIPIHNYTANINQSVQVCDGYLGGYFLNNCMPNLFTACITNNPALGTITYSTDECITYTPLQAGIDTIVLTTCGDIIFAIYTCNGWQESDPCNKSYYIINTEATPTLSTQYTTITCADTLLIDNLGYPTWNPATIKTNAKFGTASILGDGASWSTLQYIPQNGFYGLDTVVVDCAIATQITCQTVQYVIEVTCPQNFEAHINIACADTTTLFYFGAEAIITPINQQLPQHGTIKIDYCPTDCPSPYKYIANPNYTGTDTLIVNCINQQLPCISGTYIFHIDCSNSIFEQANINNVKVYPNPTKGILFISNTNGFTVPSTITLFNVLGQQVYQQINNNNTNLLSLNLDNLPVGIYALSLKNKFGEYTQKILYLN